MTVPFPALRATHALFAAALIGAAASTRSSPALDRAVKAIEGQASALRRRRILSVKAGARIMLAEPWRLARLFGEDQAIGAAMLARARREIAGLSASHAAGRDIDAGRLRGLLQAALALRWARRHGVEGWEA